MVRWIARIVATVGVAMAASACGDDNGVTSPTTDVPIVTETFAGSINPNGAFTHTFSSTRSGSVTATLTSLGSDASRIGLSLGTYNGSACAVIIAKDDAVLNTVVTGIASSLGSLCVRIYDVGALKAQTSYQVVVAHP